MSLAATTYKRSLGALGASAALLLALSACAPGADTSQSAPETSVAQQETASATKSAATQSAPAAPAAAGGLTAPGTKLKFGTAAKMNVNTGKPGSENYKEAIYETNVTKIVAGGADDLDQLQDAAKFAGQTAYYVHTDVTLTSVSMPTAGLGDPRISAQLKDGSEAQKLLVMGSMADCKTGNFKTTGQGAELSYLVGSTKSMCTVFLAPAGDAVVKAGYDGSNYVYANYSDNKYKKNPIIWE